MTSRKTGAPPPKSRTSRSPGAAPSSGKPPRAKASSRATPEPKPRGKEVQTVGSKRTKRMLFDWPTISQQYIQGLPIEGEKDARKFPTMLELAELHGVGVQTLRERAAKEKWTDQKSQWALKVATERTRARQKVLVENAVAFDERSYTAANMGVLLVTQRLAEISQQMNRMRARREAALALAEAGQPVDAKDLRSAVYYNEMQGLANALDRFQNIGMRALGTDVKKVELSGLDGEAIQVNVHAELTKDDAERTTAVLAALIDTGLFPDLMREGEEIVDAEIVTDDEDEAAS